MFLYFNEVSRYSIFFTTTRKSEMSRCYPIVLKNDHYFCAKSHGFKFCTQNMRFSHFNGKNVLVSFKEIHNYSHNNMHSSLLSIQINLLLFTNDFYRE